ncbi:MAG TPA: magnesium/cobalt transporter CorA [Anaerolineales bacterium]|nr:magnesium/cobalt transporter CorA [Anaerolineales bacterium]
MIRTIYFDAQGNMHTSLTPKDFPSALKDPQCLLWVDFEGTPPEEDEPILREIFGFHPLAIEDALQETHVPKIDDWVKYLYIVLHAVMFDKSKDEHLDTQELDIFLGKNYMVTHHDERIPAIEQTWGLIQRDERFWQQGAVQILYRLTDELATSYMPVVDEMDDHIDALEDELFEEPAPDTLERVFALKRSVLHLRRIVAPQREVLNKLARDDYNVIDPKARIYFRDVYDHLVRLYDISESIRDMTSGTLDTYLSVINNWMNDIMKTLTIITTLFMPITFVTGFFGMNFFQPVTPLGAWTGRTVFVLIMAAMLLVPSGMFIWIHRRGWM